VDAEQLDGDEVIGGDAVRVRVGVVGAESVEPTAGEAARLLVWTGGEVLLKVWHRVWMVDHGRQLFERDPGSNHA
jgi:hypothetical protein